MKFLAKTLWMGAVVALVVTSSFGTSVKAAPATKDIVDTAVAAGISRRWPRRASGRAGGHAEGRRPVHRLAPTDEAFAKLPAGTVETCSSPRTRRS